MTDVTEAMIEAGLAVFKIGPTGWSATDAATVADIYETMEAARIPAPAPDVVDCRHEPHACSVGAGCKYCANNAALSAIPIPAPTGEVERAIVAYLDAFDNGTGTVYVEPLMRAAFAALTDHTTKDDE